MLAARLNAPGGLENLHIVDVPEPNAPQAGEVLVRVHASSLNYHDYGVAAGLAPVMDGRIVLSDMSGVVEMVGPGVTSLAPGDAVTSLFFPQWQDGPPLVSDVSQTPGDGVDGFACERVVRPASAFTKAPAGWTYAEAATLTTAGLAAWRAVVVDGAIKPGDIVLVMGTGGVSLFALQFARLAGATVIATSSSDEKLERLKALGAAFTVNYRAYADWGRRVREWTGGRGVDHVIEVGGPATLTQSLEAVSVGGHIALIGVLTGYSGEVPTLSVMAKHVRLQGLVVGSRSQQEDMVRALNSCNIRPVMDRQFPLAELADAFRYQASGGHFGKIAISI